MVIGSFQKLGNDGHVLSHLGLGSPNDHHHVIPGTRRLVAVVMVGWWTVGGPSEFCCFWSNLDWIFRSSMLEYEIRSNLRRMVVGYV